MAVTAIAAIGAATSYAQGQKAAKVQKRAAQDARIAGAAQSAAQRQAAEAASARDQAARAAEANAQQAAEQLDDRPDVTVAGAESDSVRRRTVRANFNVGGAGASGSGSIRL